MIHDWLSLTLFAAAFALVSMVATMVGSYLGDLYLIRRARRKGLRQMREFRRRNRDH